MTERAVEIKAKYEKIEPTKWGTDQVFMGMVKDVGDLSKILMARGNYRNLDKDVKEALEHELVDVLWSVMVLANKTDVDLENKFWQVMDDLEAKIDKTN